MIQGFEIQTEPLNEYERVVLLPVIAQGLRTKVGRERAISNAAICKAMNAAGYKLNEARLRKVINYIRCNGVVECLIATSSGYYVATTQSELYDYEQSLLGRELAIQAVRKALTEQRHKRFDAAQQGKLFD